MEAILGHDASDTRKISSLLETLLVAYYYLLKVFARVLKYQVFSRILLGETKSNLQILINFFNDFFSGGCF